MMLRPTEERGHAPRLVPGVLVVASALFVSVTLMVGAPPADLDGKALFERRCAGCHALEADHEGPRLKDVVGRRAGSVPSFEYSKALKDAKLSWDPATLDRWLTDTDTVVPGNDMTFRVPKAEERAAIIAYLKSLK